MVLLQRRHCFFKTKGVLHQQFRGTIYFWWSARLPGAWLIVRRLMGCDVDMQLFPAHVRHKVLPRARLQKNIEVFAIENLLQDFTPKGLIFVTPWGSWPLKGLASFWGPSPCYTGSNDPWGTWFSFFPTKKWKLNTFVLIGSKSICSWLMKGPIWHPANFIATSSCQLGIPWNSSTWWWL